MTHSDMAMRIATFRFGVIADFVTGAKLSFGDKERLLDEKAARTWEIPGSRRTRIGRSTILSWIRDYRAGGYRVEALCPRPRSDKGTYKTLDTTIRMAVKQVREEYPHYTLPAVIKTLHHKQLIPPGTMIKTSSLYRFLRDENLKRVSSDARDRRKFECEHPNQIWQCDIMHGPMTREEKGPLKKAYLCAILDDHSRLIVHAQFYLSETFEVLKDCLRQAIMRRGIPQRFYVDNGACYRADQLEQILASLGIQLTHSKPYTPQGRGKIERWFRSTRDSFIPSLMGAALPLAELNERLWTHVDAYNDSEHSSIGTTPSARYRANLSCVRPAPEGLLAYFRRREMRRVRKDRTVQVHNRLFEAPVNLIDKTVELLYHEEDPNDVEVMYQGISYGKALPLDVRLNSRIGRESSVPSPTMSLTAPAPSVAAPISGKLFGMRPGEETP